MGASTAWMMVGIAALGMLGQWAIGAFHAGRWTERVDGLRRTAARHDREIQDNREQLNDHERRLGDVEGQLKARGKNC